LVFGKEYYSGSPSIPVYQFVDVQCHCPLLDRKKADVDWEKDGCPQLYKLSHKTSFGFLLRPWVCTRRFDATWTNNNINWITTIL
jgi:hypothetical protein